MIVGFRFSAGSTNLGEEGALSPTCGDGESSMSSGENHDASSVEILIPTEFAQI